MFRRSIMELSSRRSIGRIPRKITSQQIPSLLSSRADFSTSSQENAAPKAGSSGKPPESNSHLPKVFLGSVVVAGATLLAYRAGYLDQLTGKEQQSSFKSDEGGIGHKNLEETQHLEEQVLAPISKEPNKLSHDVKQVAQKVTQTDLPHVEVEQKVETHKDLPRVETENRIETHTDFPNVEAEQRTDAQAGLPHHESFSKMQGENQPHGEEKSDATAEAGAIAGQEKHEAEFFESTNSEGSLGTEIPESKTTGEPSAAVQITQVKTQAGEIPKENKIKVVPSQHLTAEDGSESALDKGEAVASLLDAYNLREKEEESTATHGPGEQALANAIEELDDDYITKDGKLVMNFLQAIHAAEKRQAELDARAFAEEKRTLKEKYEKELRDLRARELMRAEEAAILDKEIKRERAKAAAAIKALQEKMEEKLKTELEQKENEVEMKLKKIEELAKAELAAAIVSEKASQIEKMAEANLHINALCMAFYARSEEARHIHSVHKLALGALALEDALSKGLPIQQELEAITPYLDSIDKDSLLHLVLSTLPEETRHHGTETLLQLNQKFNALKGTLRHYILIPPDGGGILAHALAHIASLLRIKEVNPSGDGIESVIGRVESLLAAGKLAEAAEALQEGVQGSKAEEMAGDWVRRARNRAITEQALTVLQSYTTSISLTQ